MPPGSLLDFDTYIASLPAELIDIIQAFCSHDDLLALSSVDKAALATRFCNPRLQNLCFKTVKDTEQFLSYCQAVQDREAEELILEEGKKSRKRLKPALLPDFTTRFLSFTREHLQAIKALTLTLSDQFTAEQYDLLFTYLPGIQHLTIYSTKGSYCALGPLLKALQCLTLHYLYLLLVENNGSHSRRGFNEIEDSFDYSEDNLPDELWQLTTLETLMIYCSESIYPISKAKSNSHLPIFPEKISHLKALKSLELNQLEFKALPASIRQLDKLEALALWGLPIAALPEDMGQLTALKSLRLHSLMIKTLPVSIKRLKKLEALTLDDLPCITSLPEDISQLTTLKSLKLGCMGKLKALPTSIGQLNKLETFTLKELKNITFLPKEIGQLTALKSLTLQDLPKFETLPASIGQLDKLEALALIGMENVTALPEEISQLRALKSLTLAGLYFITALPEDIGQLTALEFLELNYLGNIKALPASIGQMNKLEVLTLQGLDNITALPEDMGQLKALKSFSLSWMRLLKALPASLGQLDRLESLTLRGLSSMTALPETMGRLNALKVIKLFNMTEFGTLPGKLAQIVIRKE
jgi:Leucine-rich repeat (LRR) protein